MVNPVKEPTDVIAGCDTVDNVPANVVAVNVVTPLNVPVSVKFLNDDKSLLASTTNTLLADTIPVVIPANLLMSEPTAVIAVDPNINPAVVNPVKEPNDVIFGCDADDNVPANVVAVNVVTPLIVPVKVKFLNDDKSLLASTTNALLRVTIPAVTPSNVLISAAFDVT